MMFDRRRFLAACATAALSPQPLPGQEQKHAGKKKGWAGGDTEMHKLFGAHWYYTWWPGGNESKAASFVPMVKEEKHIHSLHAIENMQGVDHLLGYNEPERKDQANMPLARCLELWPRLMALAEKKQLRLGSPAPSSDGGGMAFLEAFMEQVKERKLRVDFIALHWYRSRDPGAFESWVKEIARKYKRPVWVTEFNGWNGPEKENYDFLRKVLKFMERSKDVERYAYFEPGKGKDHSLLKADGSLSRMGEAYRDAGS